MFRTLLKVASFLLLFNFHSNAQVGGWDTLGLHTPLSNIIAAHHLNGRLFASHTLGINYSDDYGEHWQITLGAPINAHTIWSNNGKVYASRVLNGYDSTWVSENGGLNFEFWGRISSNIPSTQVIWGDTMYVATLGNPIVVRKAKTDIDFEAIFTCPGFSYNLELIEMGNRLVLLSTDGIRWSDDQGLNWQLSPSAIQVYNPSHLIQHQNTLFFYSPENTFMYSDNGGESWNNLPFFQNQPDLHLRSIVSEGSDLLATTFGSPLPGPDLLTWRSSDLGNTWTVTYPQIYGNEHLIQGYVTPVGKRLFTDKGCFSLSSNDAVWETKNYGLPNDAFRETVRIDATHWLVGDLYRLFLTQNYGHTYRLVWENTVDQIQQLTAFGSILIAVNSSGLGLLRSEDAGTSWHFDAAAPPGFVKFFCPENNENLLVLFQTGELYRYQLSTAAWQYLSNIGDIGSMAYTNGVLFVDGVQGIRASTDFGNNFVLQQNGFPPDFVCQKIYIAGDRVLTFSAGSSLFLSEDLGMNWEYIPKSDGSPFPSFEALAVAGDALAAYAGDGRVYFSDNGGHEWFESAVPVPSFGPVYITHLKRFEDSIYVSFTHHDRNYFVSREFSGLNFDKSKGRVFQDPNQNGIQDLGENGMANIVVSNRNTQYYALTNADGDFTLLYNQASDSLFVSLPFIHYTTTPSHYAVNSPGNDLNFGLFTDFHDLEMLLESGSLPRPGFEQVFTINVFNASLEPESGTAKILLDPGFEVLETIPPATASGDTLIWQINDLPSYTNAWLKVRCRLDSNTTIGSEVKAIAWAALNNHPDDFPDNNADTFSVKVVGAFDPNDKAALHGPSILKSALESGKRLEYLIRFQNTGNLPASFVRIRDTLNSTINPATFRLEGSSHPLKVRYAEPNVLDFFFPNINLPDSISNEPESHGFVQFSLEAQHNLQVGDSILNRAAVFFDFNPAILTPFASTVVDSDSGTKEAIGSRFFQINIHPNPVPEFSSIRVGLPDWVADGKLVEVSIFDIKGVSIQKFSLKSTHQQLVLPGVPQGVFTVEIRIDNKTGAGVLISH
ncbi:MAG: hypothetical protein H7246_13245 [Phycisphaerae bacterium]|nr:hypothetical protein [Saprospiraceae bacterium]